MKNLKWYVSDFETKTEKFYNENGYTEVWLYAICDSDANEISFGKNIKKWFEDVKKLGSCIIYFHNLKFDGVFILDYLIRNMKFEYKDKINNNDNKCYSTLIDDMGTYYSITIHFGKSHNIQIFDSLKLLPFKVEKMAKDFGLDILKLNIDYNDYTIDLKRIDYVMHDVKIVAKCLKEIKNLGMNNMTTASCAYNNYLNSLPFYRSYFPILDLDFLQKYRNAYRGGRSQVNPFYQNKVLHNVYRYDLNSMYPYIMHDLDMPVGKPIKCNKIGNYKFELYDIDVIFELKEGHLPTLLNKSGFLNAKYYTNSEGLINIQLSNIDYQLLIKHYNIIDIKFNEIYGFECVDFLFKKYIDKWYQIKNENTGAKKIVAKLMLNSLYGKFGSNPKGKSKIPFIDTEKDILSFNLTPEKDMGVYYLPIAIAVTSYAHKIIDNAICETGYNNFVYCDTDSVHTLGRLPQYLVNQTELGKFKLEGVELSSKYVRQKTYAYCEEINDKLYYEIICAGMPKNCKDYALEKYGYNIFKEFKEGFEIGYGEEAKKLLPMVVKGGVVLKETTFKIKEINI